MQWGKLFARLRNRVSYLPGCVTGQLRFTGYASGHPVMQPGKLRIRAEHIYVYEKDQMCQGLGLCLLCF